MLWLKMERVNQSQKRQEFPHLSWIYQRELAFCSTRMLFCHLTLCNCLLPKPDCRTQCHVPNLSNLCLKKNTQQSLDKILFQICLNFHILSVLQKYSTKLQKYNILQKKKRNQFFHEVWSISLTKLISKLQIPKLYILKLQMV